MANRNTHPPTEFSVEIDGKVYSATYRFERGMVSVFAAFGFSTKRGGDSPEETAKTLLRELVHSQNT